MIINVSTKSAPYNIHLQRGLLSKANEIIPIENEKVLIVSDSGVPEKYIKNLSSQFKNSSVFIFPQGEASKNFDVFKEICQKLLALGFSRKDAVIALGGGVTGDMAGFAAASYMRGISFYNIPTTLLSQVDSSIGGKTAIDLDGIKNIIGAFYQPKCVIIDPDVLSTLPERHISNGLAESIKMGVTGDKELFELCSKPDYLKNIEEIIYLSLLFKRDVVQKDEKESSLRKVLNFGHTIGHGIEASVGLGTLFHGECVGLGMLPMCGKEIRTQVQKALLNCNLPVSFDYDKDAVFDALKHDKKASSGMVTLVKSNEIGTFFFEEASIDSLKNYL